MAMAVDDPIFAPRRRLRRKAINSLFKLFARLGNRVEDLRRSSGGVEMIADVHYGPYPYNRLDIFSPSFAARPLPVMLYIHGGAFAVCSKETHRSLAAASAIGAGYLVFNIEYRLAPRFRYPAAHEDACRAYRWVVENCARYGGDPERIVVAGESAGGNLALSVGVAASYRRPEPWAREVFDAPARPLAVQPIVPYLQVSNPARQQVNPAAGFFAQRVAHDIADWYLGPHRLRAAQATMMADPIRVLEECGRPERSFPHVYSAVGTLDLCCLDVQRLESACQKLGIAGAFSYYHGEIHAFHALRWRANARKFWLHNFEFLRQASAGELPVLPAEPAPLQAAA